MADDPYNYSGRLEGRKRAEGQADFWVTWALILIAIDYILGVRYAGFSFPYIDVGDLFRNIYSLLLSIVLPVVATVVISRSIVKKRVNGAEFFTMLIMGLMISFIIFNGFLTAQLQAFVHFFTAIVFGYSYLREDDDWSGWMGWTAFLLFIDFFGYGFVKQWAFFQLIPFLSALMIAVTFSKTPTKWVVVWFWIMCVFIIFLGMGSAAYFGGNVAILQEGITIGDAFGKIKESGVNFWTNTQRAYDRQMEWATGGYYKGVEEQAKEPVGVYLENIEKSITKFDEDDIVSVWGTIKAKTLDENLPIPLSVSCYDETDDKSGDIYPEYLKNNYVVRTFEREDFSCEFKQRQLDKGPHDVRLRALFNFSTNAYLKTYFMDKGRKRALVREGIDPLDEYKVSEKSPSAVFTNGPIMVGAETTSDLPIGVDYGTTFRVGVTIENQWSGKIKEVKEIVISVPEGAVYLRCDHNPVNSNNPNKVDGMNEYIIKLKGSEFQNIAGFVSFNCLFKVNDSKDKSGVRKILGDTPISTQYIRVRTSYTYELEEKVTVEIKGSKIELSEKEKALMEDREPVMWDEYNYSGTDYIFLYGKWVEKSNYDIPELSTQEAITNAFGAKKVCCKEIIRMGLGMGEGFSTNEERRYYWELDGDCDEIDTFNKTVSQELKKDCRDKVDKIDKKVEQYKYPQDGDQVKDGNDKYKFEDGKWEDSDGKNPDADIQKQLTTNWVNNVKCCEEITTTRKMLDGGIDKETNTPYYYWALSGKCKAEKERTPEFFQTITPLDKSSGWKTCREEKANEYYDSQSTN